ncbi:MAG: protein kinase [Anaerolineae bacterium]|jgi:predicted Ser/Thr protein kinase|nr:protein kinase [Anaerolineae bacterium]
MQDLQGRLLGRYQVVEELGRGGMGVVYRAYQPSLNRHVAIKVLPPQLSLDQQLVGRFQREARAAANLRHPNIVVIYDVGEEKGIHYIVMEYLEGRTLKQLVEEEGPLHPKRAAHIVEQVAAALDYAHQRGFVHRDVKPANIFVGPGDHVTLTDFGIAKAASETQQLTRTGTLMGTPEYMSPEQASGGEVDHRTDLYALGVVLYQALVGHVPFRGTTPHAVLHNVIYEPPLAPRQVNPNLSAALEGVILKAIAKQPEQRFQRGAELVRALRRATEGAARDAFEPAAPRRPAPVAARPMAPPPRRRSALPWLLGAAAALLILGTAAVVAMLLINGGPPVLPPATQVADENPPEPTLTAAAPSSVPTSAPTAVPTADVGQREEELLARLDWRRDNGEPIVVRRAPAPPSLDGSLDEWAGPEYGVSHVVFRPENWQGRDDHAASFRAMWDGDYFYLGLTIQDDRLVQLGSGSTIYAGDDVEIQLDTDLDGDRMAAGLSEDDSQMGFAIMDLDAGSHEAYVWRPPSRERPLTLDLAARKTPAGYTVETAIPWPALNLNPQSETAYGFCLSLADTDTPGLVDQESMISTCPRREWGDPTTWGTLVLVDW